MRQITIKGNHTLEKSHELMEDLYDEILKHDDHWHFFWEGYDIFIRVKNETVKPLSGYLTVRRNIKFKESQYNENIDTTVKYFPQFLKIFHEFSVLRMEIDREDFIKVADRVAHCFLNTNRQYGAEKEFRALVPEPWDSYLYEPMVLHLLASMRAYTIGRLVK